MKNQIVPVPGPIPTADGIRRTVLTSGKPSFSESVEKAVELEKPALLKSSFYL
jgi:hypothetical protein